MQSAVLAIVNPSVRPSVCHTLALNQNDSSYDHGVFTVPVTGFCGFRRAAEVTFKKCSLYGGFRFLVSGCTKVDFVVGGGFLGFRFLGSGFR